MSPFATAKSAAAPAAARAAADLLVVRARVHVAGRRCPRPRSRVAVDDLAEPARFDLARAHHVEDVRVAWRTIAPTVTVERLLVGVAADREHERVGERLRRAARVLQRFAERVERPSSILPIAWPTASRLSRSPPPKRPCGSLLKPRMMSIEVRPSEKAFIVVIIARDMSATAAGSAR